MARREGGREERREERKEEKSGEEEREEREKEKERSEIGKEGERRGRRGGVKRREIHITQRSLTSIFQVTMHGEECLPQISVHQTHIYNNKLPHGCLCNQLKHYPAAQYYTNDRRRRTEVFPGTPEVALERHSDHCLVPGHLQTQSSASWRRHGPENLDI